MKILFDANTPAPLARFLRGHEVIRAAQLQWHELENGTLLDAAQKAGFHLVISCDQNLRYQQNFTNRNLALMILSSNHRPLLKHVGPRIAIPVDFIQAGQVVRIDVSDLLRL